MTDAPDVPDGGGEHAGHGLKGAMGKKLGPLPMGVWILAIGGGLTLTYYMRRSNPADTGTAAADTSTAPDTGGTGTGSWPYGFPNGVGQTGDSSTGTGSDPTTSTLPVTNEEWQRRAVQILVGRGYEPTAVDRAVSAYLGGEPLTTVQRAIINEAIILIGPPPVSPPSPTSPDQPPPTTTPGTPKPPTHPPTPLPWPTPHKPHPTPPTPKPKPSGPPAHVTLRISKRGQTLSDLTAVYNSRYHKHITWQEAWDFNLKYRDKATVAVLKKRGPHKTYVGSSFWFPR
jgi:hypothetical protein